MRFSDERSINLGKISALINFVAPTYGETFIMQLEELWSFFEVILLRKGSTVG